MLPALVQMQPQKQIQSLNKNVVQTFWRASARGARIRVEVSGQTSRPLTQTLMLWWQLLPLKDCLTGDLQAAVVLAQPGQPGARTILAGTPGLQQVCRWRSSKPAAAVPVGVQWLSRSTREMPSGIKPYFKSALPYPYQR